jgi:hypothetical protein
MWWGSWWAFFLLCRGRQGREGVRCGCWSFNWFVVDGCSCLDGAAWSVEVFGLAEALDNLELVGGVACIRNCGSAGYAIFVEGPPRFTLGIDVQGIVVA